MEHGKIQHPTKADITFCWIKSKDGEVNGWLEKDYSIVKGSNGWYRTEDPEHAAKIAFLIFE